MVYFQGRVGGAGGADGAGWGGLHLTSGPDLLVGGFLRGLFLGRRAPGRPAVAAGADQQQPIVADTARRG